MPWSRDAHRDVAGGFAIQPVLPYASRSLALVVTCKTAFNVVQWHGKHAIRTTKLSLPVANTRHVTRHYFFFLHRSKERCTYRVLARYTPTQTFCQLCEPNLFQCDGTSLLYHYSYVLLFSSSTSLQCIHTSTCIFR